MTINQFVAAFEEASGQSLRWWREQWLERKGIPALEFSAAVQAVDSGYRIACTFNQRGELYRVPVEIGIRTASGTPVHRVVFEQKQYSVVLHSGERPLSVELAGSERDTNRSPLGTAQ